MKENKMYINLIDLRYQKITELKDCFIELFPTYIRYRIELCADEPIINDDPSSGWENVYSSYDIIAMKKHICGIEKSFTKDKRWGIFVIIPGFTSDIRVYYRTEVAAQKMFDFLNNWYTDEPERNGRQNQNNIG